MLLRERVRHHLQIALLRVAICIYLSVRLYTRITGLGRFFWINPHSAYSGRFIVHQVSLDGY